MGKDVYGQRIAENTKNPFLSNFISALMPSPTSKEAIYYGPFGTHSRLCRTTF